MANERGHLIDEEELKIYNLRETWKSPSKSREQKIVLSKLFCGLDNINDIERFLANFRSFDDTLVYARFPALQKKYLDFTDAIAENLKSQLRGSVAKFAALMKTSQRPFMDKDLKSYPIPPADTLDWNYLIGQFKEDLLHEFDEFGQDEWLHSCLQSEIDRENCSGKELEDLEIPNPYLEDLANLLEGDKQFGTRELEPDEKTFKHSHERMLQECNNAALFRSVDVLSDIKLATFLDESESKDNNSEDEKYVDDDQLFDYEEDLSEPLTLSEKQSINSTIPTCEAPNTSSSSNVTEILSPLLRNDIMVTRNVRQPIILTLNLSNISEVKDQHLAGCAGESQGMKWNGMECLGGFEKAQVMVTKLALNMDLVNNPDLKPKYERWKKLYREDRDLFIPTNKFWSNQDLKEIFDILAKGPNQAGLLETSMNQLKKINPNLTHTMAKSEVSKWSDKVLKILNNRGDLKGLNKNVLQYKKQLISHLNRHSHPCSKYWASEIESAEKLVNLVHWKILPTNV